MRRLLLLLPLWGSDALEKRRDGLRRFPPAVDHSSFNATPALAPADCNARGAVACTRLPRNVMVKKEPAYFRHADCGAPGAVKCTRHPYGTKPPIAQSGVEENQVTFSGSGESLKSTANSPLPEAKFIAVADVDNDGDE